MWNVKCEPCGWESECLTGVARCREHNAEGLGSCMRRPTQHVCASCGQVSSVWSCSLKEATAADLTCSCGSPLVLWLGKAGFQGEPELSIELLGHSREEVFAGPCGRCQGPVSSATSGLWD